MSCLRFFDIAAGQNFYDSRNYVRLASPLIKFLLHTTTHVSQRGGRGGGGGGGATVAALLVPRAVPVLLAAAVSLTRARAGAQLHHQRAGGGWRR